MRVCDYIANKLSSVGITEVYGLVGGSTAGLNDGFISHPNINFIGFHHEQGAGHAAVGAARTTNKLSVCNVTAGCGVTNVLTSLLNAYEESAPVLFLSGNTAMHNQAKYINKEKNIKLRKYGIQDLDCISIVKDLCKFSIAIENANELPEVLHKAIFLATDGRPGPVWIDVPGNLQTAIISNYKDIFSFESNYQYNKLDIDLSIQELLKSKRPLIVAGNGINLSNSRLLFKNFLKKYKVPFVTTFLSRDLVEYDYKLNLGMIGIKGNRCANFAMQNSDCLLILGCSMNVTHIGYDSKSFSQNSKKIMIDIDENELRKDIFKIDLPIKININTYFKYVNKLKIQSNFKSWNQKCLHWKNLWPVYNKNLHRSDEGGLNLYEIVENINKNMKPKDCFIVDAGQPCYILSTNGKFREDCRYMAQAAQGDMGYAIPASVGVHFASKELNIILLIGEGSFYTNMQELAVIKNFNIPVKILVVNNDGYLSIKQTQNKFFNGRQWAVSNSTGLYFADFKKIADAFDIKFLKIHNNKELDLLMPDIMRCKEPIIVELISQKELDVLPTQAIKPDGSQGPLHDMFPFLTEDLLNSEMIKK